MPPHCDTLDGPVVKAATSALEKGNVKLILPYLPKEGEEELKKAFEKTLRARKQGKEAKEVADYWFFETAVRLHRAGEGASYTGLKPAGLDWGPVVPRAEKAIETGNPREVIEFLQHTVEEVLQEKFSDAMSKKDYDPNDVVAARKYIKAMLGFELFSHHIYTSITGKGEHEEGETMGEHEHGEQKASEHKH
ncbi:MAG: DUF6448 family protein [Candidatus Atabeyarchaeum deiterrae]